MQSVMTAEITPAATFFPMVIAEHYCNLDKPVYIAQHLMRLAYKGYLWIQVYSSPYLPVRLEDSALLLLA